MTADTQARQSFTHSFKHAGRSYTLFKRDQTKDAPYYLHFQAKNRRWKLSLKSNVQDVAVTKAKRYIDVVRAEKWDLVKSLQARQVVPPAPVVKAPSTLAEVESLYPALARITTRTAKNNVLAMHIVIRDGTSHECQPAKFTLDRLTGELVDRYQKAVIDRYTKEAPRSEAAGPAAAS
jgi:hypothetical protein